MRCVALPEQARIAVLSDVHLREPEGRRSRLFIETLHALRGQDLVVLLGDVFDFIHAGQTFYRNRWAALFGAFQELSDSGTRLAFVEGNHDFGFEHFFPQDLASTFAVVGDLELRLIHPALGMIRFRHGDDVICPWHYLPFRALVKSKALQALLGIVPARVMHGIFHSYASASRDVGERYRRLETDFLRRCLDARLPQVASRETVVLGHIHVNLDMEHAGRRVLAGPDWGTSPNVLFIDERGAFVRRDVGADASFSEGCRVPPFPYIPRGGPG